MKDKFQNFQIKWSTLLLNIPHLPICVPASLSTSTIIIIFLIQNSSLHLTFAANSVAPVGENKKRKIQLNRRKDERSTEHDRYYFFYDYNNFLKSSCLTPNKWRGNTRATLLILARRLTRKKQNRKILKVDWIFS